MNIWILASLLSLAVLVWLMLPVFRRSPPRAGHEAGVYADQAAEIANARGLGLIDQNEAETLTQEIAKRLDRATEAATYEAGAGAARAARAPKAAAMAAALGLVILVPVFSFAVYGWLGSPALPGLPHAERGPKVDPESQHLADAVASLARRMQQFPERLEGWKLLGRSAMQLADFAQAAHAFRQASNLAPHDVPMLTALAEALYFASGQRFDGESRAALETALHIDPRLAKALFYRGLAYSQAGQNRPAVQTWTDLVAIAPAGAPYLETVQRQIANAAKAGGIDLATVRPNLAPAQGPIGRPNGGPSPGPSREDVEAVSRMSEDDRAEFIRSMVARLAARLEEQPGDAAGWRRLARAYGVLGEPEKAAAAAHRANEIEPVGPRRISPAKPDGKTP